MTKSDRTFWLWAKKKDSSQPEDSWLIDETPSGPEEEWHFEHPLAHVSETDTRDALENHDYSLDIEGKEDFRKFAKRVGWGWTLLLVIVVLAQGFDFIPFTLKTEEFIAVVTTTTASIFGLTYVVGRYLYGSKAYVSKTAAGDSVAPK